MEILKKDIIEEIDFIIKLEKPKMVKIGFYGTDFSVKGLISKVKRHYLLELRNPPQFEYKKFSKFILTNKILIQKDAEGYLNFRGVVASPKKVLITYKILLHKMESSSNNRKNYFRALIPFSNELHYYYFVEQTIFKLSDSYNVKGIVIKVENIEFHLFVREHEKKRYMVIDCLSIITFEDFMKYAWSLSIANGYISGRLIQDEEYIFEYDDSEFKNRVNFSYHQLRESFETIYTPINSNPYAWVKDKIEAKNYEGKLITITQNQFSNLCRIIYENEHLRSIILLILEATNSSLLLMPAGLAVALEGLSEYFYSSHKDILNPIQNKRIDKDLSKGLLCVLGKHKENFDDNSYNTLKAKLLNINSPTNSQKLKSPFTILKIPLTQDDEETLEYRNDFLHGNINLTPRKGKKKYQMSEYEISVRLLTLLNLCFMKMIGFEGCVINHVKTQEMGIFKKINESYYR